MLSQTEICNMALAILGEASIATIDEGSHQARICGIFYEIIYKQLLRAHDWNFAAACEGLVRTGDTSARWEYVYAYPINCLFVKAVFSRDNPAKAELFEEEHIRFDQRGYPAGKRLCCNVPDAWILYTVEIKDMGLVDPLFVRAFSAKLAEEIALSLTGKMELVQLANQKYLQAMDEARIVNKWEGKRMVEEHSPILEAR